MELPLTNQILLPRKELRIEPVEGESSGALQKARWMVFDPLTRGSYRIGWIEHWFLARVDGKHSFLELVAKFRKEQPDSAISDGSLTQLLDRLLQANLFRYRGLRAEKAVRQTSLPMQLLAYRLRGINPDAWLGRLVLYSDSLLSRQAVVIWTLLAVFTSLLVIFDFQRLSAVSHLWDWIISPHASLSLFLTFLVTRAIHELGHALACKRFGARCPDIGLFFLLGAPCVYCDVSESWALPSRWQRAAVAVAGMYFEMIVATVAAWIWLLTIDSPVNTLALQTMFVCSVSTLFINANPLMRFDGYHILADLLDETNLRTKADHLAYAVTRRLILGSPWEVPRQRKLWLLVCFSFAGWGYRAFLSIAIATVIVVLGANWNLVWPARLLAASILFSWWAVPMYKFVESLLSSANTLWQKSRLFSVGIALALLATLVPIPSRRFASGWTQPVQSQGVFASNDGRLAKCFIRDGQRVKQGDALFQLTNSDLSRVAIQRLGAVQEAESKQRLQHRLRDMHGEDVDMDVYDSQMQAMNTLAENASHEVKQLLLAAPVNGMFSANYAADAEPEILPNYGNSWTATGQLGSFVRQGTLLGTVCSSQSLAVIPLTDKQLSDVAVNTDVRLTVAGCRKVVFGQVESIVQTKELDEQWTPKSPAGDQRSGTESSFAAVVAIPELIHHVPGASVDAVFVVPATTIARSIVRWTKANLRLLAD